MSAAIRLFCIPYAGAGSSVFHLWKAAFAPDVEVRALSLPGRERRMREEPVVDPVEIADTIAAAADRPYAIYGHSLGARLAFDAVRILRDIGAPLPIRLYAAAARPPDVVEDGPFDNISGLPEPEFLDRLRAGGGLPEEILAERELLDLVVPAIRVDLAWLDAYEFREAEPLPVPVVTFSGADDPLVSVETMRRWARHTSAGYQAHVLPGGHFFLHDRLGDLVQLIQTDLATARERGTAAGRGAAAHRVPLGDTGWGVWRDGLLRSTGFPVSGLDSFAAPQAAEAADAYLADPVRETDFDRAFTEAVRSGARTVRELARDPLLREAVTWQNTNALYALDHLAAADPDEPRNGMRQQRETVVLRYWQRYCGKNDTIGFFGPACWFTIDPEAAERITVKPGAGLLRDRRVWIEAWAYAALADHLAQDPGVRQWMPVFLAPHMALEGRRLLRPALPPKELSAAEAVAMDCADGRRAVDVVAELRTTTGIARDEDAYLLLRGLASQGLVVWGADLPESFDAERVLRERLAGIGDAETHDRCLAALDRLTGARDAVGAAAGDPDALRVALSRLDSVFTDLTGLPPSRRHGQMYAGRAVCFEDTSRDLDLVIGRPLLAELAPALGVLLQASRWLAAAIADAYAGQIRELYEELAADGPVRLGDLFFLAQGSLWGRGERPVDAVSAEFAARWAKLFGLGDGVTGPISVRSKDLHERAMAAFPADRPGWSGGLIHSPDIQLCAPDPDAIARGDYLAVLGEMHTAWGTFDCAAFTQWHPQVQRLIDGMERDCGSPRVRTLYPPDWPRLTGRVTHSLDAHDDIVVAYSPTNGPPRHRLLSAMAAHVVEEDGDLVVLTPDADRWPIVEAFGTMLAVHASEGFKLVAARDHLPRITVDNLVVHRETWRTTVGATGLAAPKGQRNRYLAVRRWRRALNLPERVYLKIGTEVKPFYVDLTSPAHAVSLCNAMRGAAASRGPEVVVIITEMLPDVADAWVPDGAGNRYASELRLHITDAEAVDG